MEKQLNSCGWFLEECEKTKDAIDHLRHVLGTFETERNVTVRFLEGYLAGIQTMYRKFEESPK